MKISFKKLYNNKNFKFKIMNIFSINFKKNKFKKIVN